MAEGQGPGRRGAVLVRRVERLTTGRVIPEETPGRAMRLLAALALLALILLAPRAAIGADVPMDRLFSARLPVSEGVLILRSNDQPFAGSPGERTGAVMFRMIDR
jgi:hypothetical protein